MDDDLHDIDDLFYNALEPRLQPPSNKVWNKINTQLNEGTNQKKAVFLRPKRVMAILALFLLALLGVMGYHFYQKKNAVNPSQVGANQNPPSPSATKSYNKVDDKITTNKQTPDANHYLNNSTINKNRQLLKNAAKKDTASANAVYNPKNKNLVALNNISNIYKNDKASAQKNTPLNAPTNQKNYLQNNAANALKAGDTSNLKDNSLAKASSHQPVKAMVGKVDALNKFETDEHFLLNSPITNDILIPQAQPTATPFTIKNHVNIQNTSLSQQSASDQLFKSRSVVRISPPKSRWYVSLFGAQEWQGYALQDNDDQPLQQNRDNDKNNIKHREDEDPSPTAGLTIGYQISKKFSLETGIRFGGYHIRTDSAKIFAENSTGNIAYKLITSSGYAYLNGTGSNLPLVGDSLTAKKVKQAINYIGLPILMRYKIGNGRFSFNPAIGLVFNFITKSTVSADLNSTQGDDLQHVSLHGLRNFSAVVMFNPAIYYRVGRKISVGLEPYFNYNISPINNTNVVKSYPYGLGLGAGIKYSF